jgi:hypothetical protein
VWLAKSRLSSVVIVGTLAAAGLGVATVGVHSASHTQYRPPNSSATLPMSAYGCRVDPDDHRYILCDGSVVRVNLPASYGYCYESWGVSAIVCRRTAD